MYIFVYICICIVPLCFDDIMMYRCTPEQLLFSGFVFVSKCRLFVCVK